MGEDWGRLTAAYAATHTLHERVFGGTGTTGIDDHYAAAFFEGVGAEIMGATMNGLHALLTEPEGTCPNKFIQLTVARVTSPA